MPQSVLSSAFCCVPKHFKRSRFGYQKVAARSKTVCEWQREEEGSAEILQNVQTHTALLLFRTFCFLIIKTNVSMTGRSDEMCRALTFLFYALPCVMIIYFNPAPAYCTLLTSLLMEWLVTMVIICQFLWV